MSVGDRIPTSGGAPLGQNPFGALRSDGLPPAPKVEAPKPPVAAPPAARNRGRVDIIRQTAGRGEQLAKKIQKACGAGGTVKDGCIEIQGDQRETAARILTAAGFRPVFAGG